jgi:RNA polymerase sigma-70 factor (ECF subfamily)
MEAGQPRFEADRRRREELAGRFFDALRDGDLGGLQSLLADDVATVNDGGGTVGGEGGTFGAAKAARIMVAAVPPLLAVGATFEERELNGHPGAILRDRDGGVLATWTLEIFDDQVQTIRSVTSPDKLRHLGPLADLRAVTRARGQFARAHRRARRQGN